MKFAIRDAEPSDAEAIVGIMNPIIAARVYTVLDRLLSVDEERDYIVKLPSRGIWKVAIRQTDNRLVGFQIMEPFASYTRAFDHVATLGTYVDLDLRRHGIARLLFAATFEAAEQVGYEKIVTFVRADNPIALQTYLRHGFTVIGTAQNQAKIDGRYIDEILIEKSLVGQRLVTT